MADRTRETTYTWAVEGLARYYHRSPDHISDQEVQDYLRHLLRDRLGSWSEGLRVFQTNPSVSFAAQSGQSAQEGVP